MFAGAWDLELSWHGHAQVAVIVLAGTALVSLLFGPRVHKAKPSDRKAQLTMPLNNDSTASDA